MNRRANALVAPAADQDFPRRIALTAVRALRREADLYPKPGLVSRVDAGAHHDMDAALLRRSARVLTPWFAALARAGAAGEDMDGLRALGIAAERAMMVATGGINTHRGAIFGLGLLAAAAGHRHMVRSARTLGDVVACCWGANIRITPVTGESHGLAAKARFGAGGARAEAAAGFPSAYRIGLPALRAGEVIARGDPDRARVHACMALIAQVEDTNLLYRGGAAGLTFAQSQARAFMAAGGVAQADWRAQAIRVHDRFVTAHLSPGGAADLLAMTLFLADMGECAG